jgi:MFS family permease
MSDIRPLGHPMGLGASATFTPAVRRYVLGILVVVYTFNFIDRQILSILLEPIRRDLDIQSDAAMGALTGFAFALFYATLGIPIARLADRSNRRNLIAISLTIWSAMTAVSGLVQNYWQLLIARIGVGVGEAGCSPPAHSMISDYYPPAQRATALGIYALGIPVGILFGFLAGGWIEQFFGWRVAFFVVGIPGLFLALVLRYTVKEPPRGMAEGKLESVEQPGVMATFRFLMRKKSFRHLAVGGALTAFVGYGFTTFAPTFLARSYAMESGEIGTWLGLILGIPGGIGIVLGGWLADRFGARDTRWYLWIVSVALLASVPFNLGIYLAPEASLALLCMVIPVLLGNFYQATTFSQTQGLVELRMRAVAAAVLLFIINIVGLGLGPQMVGIVSDLLKPSYGEDSVRYALMILSLANAWSAWHYYIAGKHLKAELVQA